MQRTHGVFPARGSADRALGAHALCGDAFGVRPRQLLLLLFRLKRQSVGSALSPHALSGECPPAAKRPPPLFRLQGHGSPAPNPPTRLASPCLAQPSPVAAGRLLGKIKEEAAPRPGDTTPGPTGRYGALTRATKTIKDRQPIQHRRYYPSTRKALLSLQPRLHQGAPLTAETNLCSPVRNDTGPHDGGPAVCVARRVTTVGRYPLPGALRQRSSAISSRIGIGMPRNHSSRYFMVNPPR